MSRRIVIRRGVLEPPSTPDDEKRRNFLIEQREVQGLRTPTDPFPVPAVQETAQDRARRMDTFDYSAAVNALDDERDAVLRGNWEKTFITSMKNRIACGAGLTGAMTASIRRIYRREIAGINARAVDEAVEDPDMFSYRGAVVYLRGVGWHTLETRTETAFVRRMGATLEKDMSVSDKLTIRALYYRDINGMLEEDE